MCCRTFVAGEPEGIEHVMEAVGMEPYRDAGGNVLNNRWVRHFAGDKEVRVSSATFLMGDATISGFEIAIFPSIGDHSLEKHAVDALIGSFMFELTQALSVRAGGSDAWQKSLVGQCREEAGSMERILTTGEHRMTQDDVCLGFRTVLAKGVHQVGQDHEDLGYHDETEYDDPLGFG